MHPTLMTMIADDRAQGLRSAAESRRGAWSAPAQRRFFVFRRPRRSGAGGARLSARNNARVAWTTWAWRLSRRLTRSGARS